MSQGVMSVSAEAIRGYIRTLRIGREKTQPDMAHAINMGLRTYKEWELGNTKDIKAPYLIRALHFLSGSIEQIASLTDAATLQDGIALAEERLRDPLFLAVEELKASGQAEQVFSDPNFNRFLDLVAGGMSPQEAAQIVRDQP
jgi:transcriptional regulator with XRE-family HTH domain